MSFGRGIGPFVGRPGFMLSGLGLRNLWPTNPYLIMLITKTTFELSSSSMIFYLLETIVGLSRAQLFYSVTIMFKQLELTRMKSNNYL